MNAGGVSLTVRSEPASPSAVAPGSQECAGNEGSLFGVAREKLHSLSEQEKAAAVAQHDREIERLSSAIQRARLQVDCTLAMFPEQPQVEPLSAAELTLLDLLLDRFSSFESGMMLMDELQSEEMVHERHAVSCLTCFQDTKERPSTKENPPSHTVVQDVLSSLLRVCVVSSLASLRGQPPQEDDRKDTLPNPRFQSVEEAQALQILENLQVGRVPLLVCLLFWLTAAATPAFSCRPDA